MTLAMVALTLMPSFAPVPSRCGTALSSPAAASALPISPAPTPSPFTWTAGGDNDRWEQSGNWSHLGGGYPDDCSDDAIIPYVSGGCDVVLVTEEIDDLTIEGDLYVSAPAASEETLKVDSLTIMGGVVTFANYTRIETATSCQP